MKVKNKKALFTLLFSACVLLGYAFWLILRPVEIIAVHYRENSFSSVLVRNFPLTVTGKLNWWIKNKALLKEKFDIPKIEKDSYFEVIFWDFGEGYKKTDGYDRLCFDDIKPPLNCIKKNAVFSIILSAAYS